MNTTITCICSPENFNNINKHFSHSVCNLYKIESNHLTKSKTPPLSSNFILGICEVSLDNNKMIHTIFKNIVYEYNKSYYEGIYLDCNSEIASELVYKLDGYCKVANIPLFVPFSYAKSTTHATLVFDTVISGGNLKNILEYALIKHKKLAVNIPYVAKQVQIPVEDTIPSDLHELPDLTDKNVFFSNHLYMNYFTQMDGNDKCIFTTFDDSSSFEKKLEMIQLLGIDIIFMTEQSMERFNLI